MEKYWRTTGVLLAGLLVGLVHTTPPAHAQLLRVGEHGIEAAFYSGGAFYGDLLERTGRATELDANGQPTRTVPFRRAISAAAAGSVGIAVAYWLTPTWALRLHGSISSSRFTVEDEAVGVGRSEFGIDRTPARESGRFAPLTVRAYDASVVFRIPARIGELAPYALLGSALVSYRAHPDEDRPVPVGAQQAFRSGSRASLGGVAGVGAIYSFGPVSAAVEVTDHLAPSPIRPNREEEEFHSDRLIVSMPLVGEDEIGARPRRLVNNIQVVAGLTFMIRLGR